MGFPERLYFLWWCVYIITLHIVFYMSRVGSQSCKVLAADPVAQILGGLRVKQEAISRRLLLWRQEVTFDKRWNSQTQFLGPQEGFCHIRTMWDPLPWWSCSGTPRNHLYNLPAYLEIASHKTLSVFCQISWTNAVLQSIAFQINGSGWFLFFLLFFLLI